MAQRIIPDRFLDAGEEPEQTLTPIKGYEKAPLVSLKEAIQPIKSLFYDADAMVGTAIRNSRKPANGLTQDESAAVHLYTMQWPKPHPSLYYLLNQRLRSKNRDTLTSWFLFLKLFFTALYKLPSFKGVIFRGVRGNLTDQYDDDQIWWGASSCTETMNVMETFVGVDGIRTLFTIECINGKSIKDHTYFTEENEILLMPGTYFQVVNKWKAAKDLYMIHLREKIPPYETVASPFDLSSSLTETSPPKSLNKFTTAMSVSDSNTALSQSFDILKTYCKNLQDNKLLIVHLFADDKSSGNDPLVKIQLLFDATYKDLVQAIPESLRERYSCFSIAGRPLIFNDNITVLSAVCCARYAKTKFVELPLCITVHERLQYTHSDSVAKDEVPDYKFHEFQEKFMSKCQTSEIHINAQLNRNQTFSVGNLSFTFTANCASEDLSIEILYIFSPDFQTFQLPECVCLFQVRYHNKYDKLNDMPIVSFNGVSNIRLYNWVLLSSYWFTSNTRHIRLPFIGGVHAFIRHTVVIPSALTLPPDMFIPSADNKILLTRENPVYCQCLPIRKRNVDKFPHIAYHGTNINVIPSILMDGLVMPNTIVSSGGRICIPPNHIAAGITAFGIPDLATGIFVSPSIHYCCDPAFAVTFTDGDQYLIPILECGIKKDSFVTFPCVVPVYKPHPNDDMRTINWRLTDPAAIEIISVLFIRVIK